jgi:subtilisin family serine protease
MTRWISPDEARLAMARGQGAGVRVAILDSGIEIGHPAFAGKRLRDDVAVSLDGFTEGGGVDIYGHGTALASIIWRLAPEAEIGSFRVLGANLAARSALVVRAAEKATALGYHILNCSFACGISGQLALYKNWTDRAALEGIHVVAASGSRVVPEWPAHLGTVLGVDCAMNSHELLGHRQGGLVEFVAPGEEIDVAWKDGGRRLMTGSSFAAAHVTGLMARLLSEHPIRDPLLLKAVLRRLAKPASPLVSPPPLRKVAGGL